MEDLSDIVPSITKAAPIKREKEKNSHSVTALMYQEASGGGNIQPVLVKQ